MVTINTLLISIIICNYIIYDEIVQVLRFLFVILIFNFNLHAGVFKFTRKGFAKESKTIQLIQCSIL